MASTSIARRLGIAFLTIVMTLVIATSTPLGPATPALANGCLLWNGTVYAVDDEADLDFLRSTPICLSQTVVQTANIDLSALNGSNWVPVSNFAGTYDGNGKTISGLVLDGNNAGLFGVGVAGATIKNLTVSVASSSGGEGVGAIVGVSSGHLVIDNVHASGTVTGSAQVGGLVGQATIVEISNSSIAGEVTGNLKVGGFVGFASSEATILDSSSTGTTACDDPSFYSQEIGGFIGGAPSATISHSSSEMNVEGSFQIGGFVGQATNLSVTDSSTSGRVTGGGGGNSGGFVGYAENVTVVDSHTSGILNGSAPQSGGMIGLAVDITISGSSSSRAINIDTAWIGGLVGWVSDEADISESNFTGSIQGLHSIGGLLGWADDDTTVNVSSSWVSGDVEGGDIRVGGLIGHADGVVTLTDSYMTGDVEGTDLVGGLVGYSVGDLTASKTFTSGTVHGLASAGGLVGRSFSGTLTIHDSYSTGNVTGHHAGGLVGFAHDSEVLIARSYTRGDVSGTGLVGGFVGSVDGSSTSSIGDSYCLDGTLGCSAESPLSGRPALATDLKSRGFFRDSWDFSTVWCIRGPLNDGFPVLRAIDFGPGDTNGCRSNRRSSKSTVTFDPAGGVCGNHSSSWTQSFRGTLTLPTATDCARDGFVLLGWTRDPSLTTPEHLLSSVIARPGTLTAVWGALPAAPTQVTVIANLFCTQNCNSAIIVWPSSTSTTDTTVIAIDGTLATCNNSGEVFGLTWCWISDLTPATTHTTSIAWRNQYGNGPTTTTTFTLN